MVQARFRRRAHMDSVVTRLKRGGGGGGGKGGGRGWWWCWRPRFCPPSLAKPQLSSTIKHHHHHHPDPWETADETGVRLLCTQRPLVKRDGVGRELCGPSIPPSRPHVIRGYLSLPMCGSLAPANHLSVLLFFVFMTKTTWYFNAPTVPSAVHDTHSQTSVFIVVYRTLSCTGTYSLPPTTPPPHPYQESPRVPPRGGYRSHPTCPARKKLRPFVPRFQSCTVLQKRFRSLSAPTVPAEFESELII